MRSRAEMDSDISEAQSYYDSNVDDTYSPVLRFGYMMSFVALETLLDIRDLLKEQNLRSRDVQGPPPPGVK